MSSQNYFQRVAENKQRIQKAKRYAVPVIGVASFVFAGHFLKNTIEKNGELNKNPNFEKISKLYDCKSELKTLKAEIGPSAGILKNGLLEKVDKTAQSLNELNLHEISKNLEKVKMLDSLFRQNKELYLQVSVNSRVFDTIRLDPKSELYSKIQQHEVNEALSASIASVNKQLDSLSNGLINEIPASSFSAGVFAVIGLLCAYGYVKSFIKKFKQA